MRILVGGAFEASSQWAHAINTVKMAQAFSRLGHKVTVVCFRPAQGKIKRENLAQLYGLTEQLNWLQLPIEIRERPMDQHWGYGLLALTTLPLLRPRLIFARSYIFPYLSSKIGFNTVAESHAHPENRTASFLRFVRGTHYRAFRLWVTISKRLADRYRSLGVPADKLTVLPDAVDLKMFERPQSSVNSPYNNERPNVAYTGHLYDWKGIPTVLNTASLLPDINFHLVGGWPEDIDRQKKRAADLGLMNVTFHGLHPMSAVPPYLWHADALLLPPSQHHPSAAWTSPVKLGEYLASGTPVVSTDIPALRDWLTDDETEFVRPDDPISMAEGIRRVLTNKLRTNQLIKNGLKKAAIMSYEQRAMAILSKSGF